MYRITATMWQHGIPLVPTVSSLMYVAPSRPHTTCVHFSPDTLVTQTNQCRIHMPTQPSLPILFWSYWKSHNHYSKQCRSSLDLESKTYSTPFHQPTVCFFRHIWFVAFISNNPQPLLPFRLTTSNLLEFYLWNLFWKSSNTHALHKINV